MKQKPILISIITVVYNGEKFLEQTITSVLNQSYRNVEYIIVDGNSTDKSVSIIKKYENRIAKWISEPDRGIYDAMNKGISLANGKYIGLINADDWYEPNAVEKVVKAIREVPGTDIIHGKLNFINLYTGRSFILTPIVSLKKLLWNGMSVYHPTMFVKRIVYEERKYDTDLKISSDLKFVLECLLSNKSFFYVDSVIANFRSGGKSNDLILRAKESFIVKRQLNLGVIVCYISTLHQALLNIAFVLKHYFQRYFFQNSIKIDR